MKNKIIYDNIIVVSTNVTCWDEDEDRLNENSELISVNCCMLSVDTLRTHTNSMFLIKPQRSNISDYCYELTGITQKSVDNALGIDDVLKKIEYKFNTRSRVWATFGLEDKNNIENLKDKNIFNKHHINIKCLMPIIFNMKQELDIFDAVAAAGLQYEGDAYSTKDYAYNASRVLAEVIRGGVSHK